MDESLEETSATTDLQVLRRQARQRFMGALVLVIAAVVALPFVLDTKPRPVSPDIAIEIKNTPISPTSPTPPTNAPLKPEPTPAAVVAPSPAASAPLAFPQAVEPAVIAEPATKPDDGARAAALLNGSGYQIQAGSFTDKSKVQALQTRLEKAGYSVQTQDAVGRDGLTYTRIRVGPYATQVDANAAASRINKLGIKTIVIKP
jgi:DedD protein